MGLQKKKKKGIVIFLILIIVLGIVLGVVDYNRIKRNEYPLFCVKTHDENYKEEACIGLGYKMTRKISISPKQPLNQSLRVKFGLWFYTIEVKDIKEGMITDVAELKVDAKERCSDEINLYYSNEKQKIYVYCVDSITVSDNKNTIELNNYLKNNDNKIDDIIAKFTKEPEGSYDDGGTKLYRGDNFNILKCHTISNNNNIYIGNKNMGYFNSFCK